MTPCQVRLVKDCPSAPDAHDYFGHFAVMWTASSGRALVLVNADEFLWFHEEAAQPHVLMPVAEC